mmetsp:Transcript_17312/g.41000  ORF Transcript_17312/g.41000 Transcript_17312/m.41000 type:complete len:131 (+) Transcript_17312:1-393(+)
MRQHRSTSCFFGKPAMGAICTVEQADEKGSMVFTPSCKANDCKAEEASTPYPELYEWKEDRGTGPSAPRLEDHCDSLAALQKRHAPMTHAATLHPLSKTKPWDKEKTMSTKHSMPSSEYMGPIDSGISNM